MGNYITISPYRDEAFFGVQFDLPTGELITSKIPLDQEAEYNNVETFLRITESVLDDYLDTLEWTGPNSG